METKRCAEITPAVELGLAFAGGGAGYALGRLLGLPDFFLLVLVAVIAFAAPQVYQRAKQHREAHAKRERPVVGAAGLQNTRDQDEG